MKTLAIQTAITSNKRLVALLVLLLLSSVGMFGQEVETPASAFNTSVILADAQEQEMELVSWFMASKQTQTIDSNNFNAISTNGSGKKAMINSGLTPNRILSRTFLKKLKSQQSTIA